MWPFAAAPVVQDQTSAPPVPPPPVIKREPRKPRTIKPFVPPSPEQILQEDIMNHPITRFGISGVLGGGMGAVFGIVMGGTDPITPEAAEAAKTTPWRQQAVKAWRSAMQRSWSYAKGFALFGAVFAGSEATIEAARGQHDLYNSVSAGCFTGAALAVKQGPTAMCVGCAGMATFSYFIDRFFEGH